MKLIIDRFEGDFAIIEAEGGLTFSIPRELVKCTKEGDVLNLEYDEAETKKRRKGAEKLMGELFE